MAISRRDFVGIAASASAYLVAQGVAGCNRPQDNPKPTYRSMDSIGVQLYTVRSLMENDVDATLDAVRAVGYDEVEFAGYFGKTAAHIRAKLSSLGLHAPSAHITIEQFTQETQQVLDFAEEVGHRFLVVPWLAADQRTLENYRQLCDTFNTLGEECHKRNIQFAYHNHEFEFENVEGEIPFDILLDNTDPSLVQFELDLFWIRKGGEDPLRYFTNYPGRFPLCHVKDMAAGEEMVSVGSGEIDFATIFSKSELAGLQHYFVEHDNAEYPMESIRRAYSHLEGLQIPRT